MGTAPHPTRSTSGVVKILALSKPDLALNKARMRCFIILPAGECPDRLDSKITERWVNL